jgi:hypothetical protein
MQVLRIALLETQRALPVAPNLFYKDLQKIVAGL